MSLTKALTKALTLYREAGYKDHEFTILKFDRRWMVVDDTTDSPTDLVLCQERETADLVLELLKACNELCRREKC